MLDKLFLIMYTFSILNKHGVSKRMERQNKKKSVAALHRENIMSAAEKLFLEKGINATTIEDISKFSEYSRRTIYSYFESKEDILYHIVFKGLSNLKTNLSEIIKGNQEFISKYFAICHAMADFQFNSPQSTNSVNKLKNGDLAMSNPPEIIIKIFEIGNEINGLLAEYLEFGKKHNKIRKEIETMKSVYILWTSITSLLSLAESKGFFLEQEFGVTTEQFLQYGYTQIINSILEERI